jgi:hypothetical protein
MGTKEGFSVVEVCKKDDPSLAPEKLGPYIILPVVRAGKPWTGANLVKHNSCKKNASLD